MIKKLAVALSVTLFCASPAMAAYVVPRLGEIDNTVYVSEGSALSPSRRSDGGHDGGQWLAEPRTLMSSSVASLFASAGGFAGADQQIDAVWSSEDAGTVSIDFEALIVAPGDNLLAANERSSSGEPESAWKYKFRSTEDSVLTFNIALSNEYIGADRAEIMFGNYGRLVLTKELPARDIFIASTNFGSSFSGTTTIRTTTYELFSGNNYILEYQPHFFSLGRNYPGTTLFQGSQEISWSIGARPVEPPGPGPGSAAPEPATWAMLMMGFGLIGSAARRRRSLRLSRLV
jgi:hypothetical protein